MSKRREPGEIVRRKAGSGFVGSAEPELIKVPDGKAYEYNCIRDENGKWQLNPGGEADSCGLLCGDRECREWPNLEIMGGPHKGNFMYHISECQMDDLE